MTDGDEYQLITIKEASKILGVTPRTLEYWRQTEQGPPYYRLPVRRIRYKKSAVEAWAESAQVQPAQGRENNARS